MDGNGKNDNKVIWFKCFSKKKKLFYYNNYKTKESYWEKPCGPNDVVIDVWERVLQGAELDQLLEIQQAGSGTVSAPSTSAMAPPAIGPLKPKQNKDIKDYLENSNEDDEEISEEELLRIIYGQDFSRSIFCQTSSSESRVSGEGGSNVCAGSRPDHTRTEESKPTQLKRECSGTVPKSEPQDKKKALVGYKIPKKTNKVEESGDTVNENKVVSDTALCEGVGKTVVSSDDTGKMRRRSADQPLDSWRRPERIDSSPAKHTSRLSDPASSVDRFSNEREQFQPSESYQRNRTQPERTQNGCEGLNGGCSSNGRVDRFGVESKFQRPRENRNGLRRSGEFRNASDSYFPGDRFNGKQTQGSRTARGKVFPGDQVRDSNSGRDSASRLRPDCTTPDSLRSHEPPRSDKLHELSTSVRQSARFKCKTPMTDRLNKKKEELIRKQIEKCKETPSLMKPEVSVPEPSTSLQETHIQREPNTVGRKSEKRKDPPITDLRQKLESKKRKPANVTAVVQPDTMDWEDIDEVRVKEKPRESEPVPEPQYKNVYVVFDTSALTQNSYLAELERLLQQGHCLGTPVTIVIPYKLLQELDGLKNRKDDPEKNDVENENNVGRTARKASSLIMKHSMNKNKYLTLQQGCLSHQATGGVPLECNDDYILNCCIQQQALCADNEIAVLMTKDHNLTNKALSFGLMVHTWNSLKAWARGMRGDVSMKSVQKPSQEKKTEEPMDVDMSDGSVPAKFCRRSFQDSEDEMFEDGIENNSGAKSIAKEMTDYTMFQLLELKLTVEEYLKNVIEEVTTQHYGELKDKVNKVRPTWTFPNYVTHLRQHWSLVTGRLNPSEREFQVLHQLVQNFKKVRKDSEHQLSREEVEGVFAVCENLANQLREPCTSHTTDFLCRLEGIREEVKERLESDTECRVSVDPVDVALQNIQATLKSEYELLEGEVQKPKSKTADATQDGVKDITNEMWLKVHAFVSALDNLENVIQRLEEESKTLTEENKDVRLLMKTLHQFTTPFSKSKIFLGLDVEPGNIVSFFSNPFSKTITDLEDVLRSLKISCRKLLRQFSGLDQDTQESEIEVNEEDLFL